MKKIQLLFIFSLLIVGEIKAQFTDDPCSNKKTYIGFVIGYGIKHSMDLQVGIGSARIPGLAFLGGIKLLEDTSMSNISREKSGYHFIIPTIGVSYKIFLNEEKKRFSLTPIITYGIGKKEYGPYLEMGLRLGYNFIENQNFDFHIGANCTNEEIYPAWGVSVFF